MSDKSNWNWDEKALKEAEREMAKIMCTMAPPSNLSLLPDLDPPSHLPAREPLPPRTPDLCPDDSQDKGKP